MRGFNEFQLNYLRRAHGKTNCLGGSSILFLREHFISYLFYDWSLIMHFVVRTVEQCHFLLICDFRDELSHSRGFLQLGSILLGEFRPTSFTISMKPVAQLLAWSQIFCPKIVGETLMR